MIISFDHVSKSFKSNEVLKDISFDINKGEFICIIGPSGCGKTTALKMINKLIKPTSGTVYVDGKDVSTQDDIELRRNIGYVIQQTGLFPHMTVRENIELIPHLKDKKADLSKKTLDLLHMVGLQDESFLDRYPIELSGGQQQRIGVARAFASDPEIILMDEPFSALDPITRTQLQDELINLQATVRKTIAFVTHDMGEAIKLSDRICIMNDGLIQQFDTPEEILKHPANEYIRQFVGAKRIWQSPEFIRVQDIMIETAITCPASMQVVKAVNTMFTRNIDSLLVIDRAHHFLGVLEGIEATKEENHEKKVTEVMNTHPLTVSPNDSIVDVVNLTTKNKNYTLPVVDDNNILVGLITKSTLVSALSQQYTSEEKEGD